MTVTDALVANNTTYAQSYDGSVAGTPALRVVVVACMDARLDVYRALGLRRGEAHVLRNGGGAVTDDVIRSLALSQRLLGTEEIVLVHHTQCGLQTVTDAQFKGAIRADTGLEPPWDVETFTDTDEDVRKGMARIRANPFLPHREAVRGFVFDVSTGLLREVV